MPAHSYLRFQALALLLILPSVSHGQTPANYTNPLAINGADPHVIDNRARDGFFYLYYTDGMNTSRYRSTNLVSWSNKGTAYSGSHAPHSVYWAPTNTYFLFGNYFRASSTAASTTFTSIDNRFGFDQLFYSDPDGSHYVLVGGAGNPHGVFKVNAPDSPITRIVRPHFTPYITWTSTYEGPWVHRLGPENYVLMLSVGAANGASYSLAFATGPSPEGPWSIDHFSVNSTFLRRSDSEGIYGPGHHAMIPDDNGTAWVFYQQKDGSASAWDRKIATDPLWFDVSGIPHMRPTRGTSRPGPGSPESTLWPARVATATHQAESHDGSALVTIVNGGTSRVLDSTLPRAYAAYRRVDFGSTSPLGFSASIASSQAFTSALEVRLDGRYGPLLARLTYSNTGSSTTYQTFSTPLLQQVTGIRDIVLVFTGPVPFASNGTLDHFTFTTTAPAGTLNQSPIANPDFIPAVGGSFIALNPLANDSDPDGDPLTMRGRANVTTTVLADNSLLWYTPASIVSEVQFPYSIDDGRNGFATADVIVKVAPSPGAHAESSEFLVFEAEDFHQAVPTADSNTWFEASTQPGFGGRGYVTTTDSGTTSATRTGARLDYGIDITTPGIYHVWVRSAAGQGTSGSDLSEIALGIDLYDFSYDDLQTSASQEWHWTRLGALQSLRAGLHRFSLLRRGDGHLIDRFVLTTDPDYSPESLNDGFGPACPIPAPRTPPANPPTDPFAKGSILREVWWNIAGNNVSDLTSHARYALPPNAIEHIPNLSPQIDQGDNFGARLRGWLHPSATGSHTFALSSDNQSELWLSTTDSPADKVRIISASGGTASVNLTAGNRYYIEVLHKEGTFADNLFVRWQAPGASSQTVIDGAFLSPFPLPPPAPVRLNAFPVSHDSVLLQWGDIAPNEVSQEIRRSTDNGATWLTIATLPANQIQFTDNEAPADSAVLYSVRASNSAGDSSWSNPAPATTPQTPSLAGYAAWAGTFDWPDAASSNPEEDPDGDGLVNLLEYATGSNPLGGSFPVNPLSISASPVQLSFNRIEDPLLSYNILHSTDLQVWNPNPVWSSTGSDNTPGAVLIPLPLLVPEGTQGFFRLLVQASAP